MESLGGGVFFRKIEPDVLLRSDLELPPLRLETKRAAPEPRETVQTIPEDVPIRGFTSSRTSRRW